jgi:hypothetical protein
MEYSSVLELMKYVVAYLTEWLHVYVVRYCSALICKLFLYNKLTKETYSVENNKLLTKFT